MKTAAWLGLLLIAPLLSGCLGIFQDDGPDRDVDPADVGYDASKIHIDSVSDVQVTVTARDGVGLDTLIYEPLTSDTLPNGDSPTFPVVVFLHGWGFPKEMYTNAPLSAQEGSATPVTPPNNDLLMDFAEGGLISVAYDARGWYRSGGVTSIAGEDEMHDLEDVIAYVNDHYPTNGKVGVTGISYGGGQAFRAWAENPSVTTAVPHAGWTDLYQGLAPGNTPKLEWMEALVATGVVGTHGSGTSADLSRWYLTATTRQSASDVDGIHAELDTRSILGKVATTYKPLFTCQGMQESLFPQAHLAWQAAPGFVRAHYFQGGHNTLDAVCWQKTKEWFQFFLEGLDTGVDSWAYLSTVDTARDKVFDFSEAQATSIDAQTYYLRNGQFVGNAFPNATFTVSQRIASNPFSEPSVVWDTIGQPYNGIPEEFRQDPTGVVFTSAPLDVTHTLFGSPTVTLKVQGDSAPFQVVATLTHNGVDGSRVLGRSAFSAIGAEHVVDGMVTIALPWVHTEMDAGDTLSLKLASNDPGMFVPLFANYDAVFTGASSIEIPYFDNPAQSG